MEELKKKEEKLVLAELEAFGEEEEEIVFQSGGTGGGESFKPTLQSVGNLKVPAPTGKGPFVSGAAPWAALPEPVKDAWVPKTPPGTTPLTTSCHGQNIKPGTYQV